ncbi:S-layer homology domain-containing protein [Paenibacillus aurantius]|uniref:S-layer homology domain-containing protein n=1 Tax=Paenibacillus aurantius TaxID=2918900 RepID=A0AA96LBL5_9BACL|nr:S-layer homology domain-containing protein [Paenibacillus aurantius]WNQ10657.1 S-layer homology domain-containing protein [Paenibacillus aurantius]
MVLVAAISFSAGSAAAFGDVDPKKGEAILALKERGIVSGVGGDRFAPDQDMTYAEGLSLVMKGLLQGAVGEREADPTAGPWYAGLVEQAKTVGLPLPAGVDPSASLTEEEFASLLNAALTAAAPDRTLPEAGKPAGPSKVTRAKAAEWVYQAIRFLETAPAIPITSDRITPSRCSGCWAAALPETWRDCRMRSWPSSPALPITR